MNYKNIFKRETKVIAIVVICMTLVVIGASYAMFLQVNKNTNNQVVETGSLVITYTNANGEAISPDDVISSNSCLDPMSDDDAAILTDCMYKLNIRNSGSLPASYRLVIYNNVSKLPSGGTFVNHSLMRIGLKKGNETLAPFKTETLTDFKHTTETIGVTAQNDIRYVLDEGVLEANKDISYSVQAWINEDIATSAVSGQYVYLKLEVSGVVSENTPITSDENSGANQGEDEIAQSGRMMKRSGNDTYGFWALNSNITKVVFEPTMNPHETREDLIFDVSENQDKSVMSYLVPNSGDATKYTLYIQADGGVKANPDSSDLFFRFSNLIEIQGMEYFDTNNVTNLYRMFSGCTSLTSLDVSRFDTSKVTDMSGMFSSCSSLTNLDVSNFDTRNVTDMQSMFSRCSSLTSLDVSNFDTSNVTSMEYMFFGCNSLTSLDVSRFDTSNVTGMSGMFSSCSSLTNLDVSNFDTRNVINMITMFDSCSGLTSLDVSHFDTSSVIDMSWMFSNCSSLTSLDLSSFNTSKVTTMERMFNSNGLLQKIIYSDKFVYANDATFWSMFGDCPANKPTHESWNGKF